MTHNPFQIPIHDPILAFLLILSIILLSPIIMGRLKIPSIIGLIVAGVIIGPHGLFLLERNSSTILFSTIGLMYIMFLAALELDLHDFRQNRNRSLIFGALTFSLPFSVGVLACRYVLGFEWIPTILVSSMFSTHTLLSYPIASRLGLGRNETVTVAVGGTIITDTAVLLVLAGITGLASGEANLLYWGKLLFSLSAFSFLVLWGFPRIGAWFFKNIEGEKTAHYIFVLTMVFFAGFLAEISGVEAIIGAFLAGLALNSLIPHKSVLMNRIEFTGNSLFIPYFLISVGMLVDLRVLLQGWGALTVAIVLTVVALVGKWLASLITGFLFKYTKHQTNLLFGLTSAHAAATIAVVTVGYDLEIIDENVLNGTILLILITCLVASFVTEKSGRTLALNEERESKQEDNEQQIILATVKNIDNMTSILDLATFMKESHIKEPIHVLRVAEERVGFERYIQKNTKILDEAASYAAASETEINVINRLDINVASGIHRVAKEINASHLLLGWKMQVTPSERIFGTTLEKLLSYTNQNIFVCNFKSPVNTFNRLVILVPSGAEREKGFYDWVNALDNLTKNLSAQQLIYSTELTKNYFESSFNEDSNDIPRQFKPFDDWEDFLIVTQELQEGDLLIIVSAHQYTISYNPYLDKVPSKLAKHFSERSFIIIYPEQYAIDALELSI